MHICWKGGPTIVSNGSYSSTSIPAVTAGNEQGLLTRSLYPPQPTYDYSLQSHSPPNQTSLKYWEREGDLSVMGIIAVPGLRSRFPWPTLPGSIGKAKKYS